MTTLTTIIAATVPLTTAVWGSIQKDKELAAQGQKEKHEAAMEELKLKHQIEMDYLDRLKSDPERLRTLRMVEKTNDDKKLVDWAKSEEGTVQADVDALNKTLDEKTAAVDATQKQLAEALADGKAKAGVVAQLRVNFAAENAQLAQLRAQKGAAPIAIIPRSSSVIAIPVQDLQAKCFAEGTAIEYCAEKYGERRPM